MLKTATATGVGVLAALLHDLLQQQTFTSLTDTADALKWRAAKKRIPYDGGRISAACVSVGRTRPLITEPRRAAGQLRPDAGPVSDADAAAILHRLGVRVL